MNIIVDLNCPIQDGTEVKFRSPVDCSQVTGLIVHYTGGSQEFAFADAHGNNVGDVDHLFAEDVVVKVILDVTKGMAFVQNADTNAYIESTFIKTVNGTKPDKNGNVNVAGGGGGGGVTEKQLAETLEEAKAYTDSVTANCAMSGDVENMLGDVYATIDEVVGDIESALDELHTYAQGLINGGGA